MNYDLFFLIGEKLKINDQLKLLQTNSHIRANLLERYGIFQGTAQSKILPVLLEIRHDPERKQLTEFLTMNKVHGTDRLSLMKEVIRQNYMVFLRYIITKTEYISNKEAIVDLMYYAFYFGQLETILLIKARTSTFLITFFISDIDCYPRVPINTDLTLMEIAALRGHVNIINFFFNTEVGTRDLLFVKTKISLHGIEFNLINILFMTGKLNMIKWYYTQYRNFHPRLLNQKSVDTAFIFGQQKILKWAAERRQYPRRATAIQLYEEYRILKNEDILDFPDDHKKSAEEIIDARINKLGPMIIVK